MQVFEKIRLLRQVNGLTQAAFAESIGVSRGNLANIELGKVQPTLVFINCVSLMYHVERDWLLDDARDELSALNSSAKTLEKIMLKYEMLDERYKRFIDEQINRLLEIQREQAGV